MESRSFIKYKTFSGQPHVKSNIPSVLFWINPLRIYRKPAAYLYFSCMYIHTHIIFYLLQGKLVILNLTLILQHLLFHSLPKSRLAASQRGKQGLWPRSPSQGRSCSKSCRRHCELLLPTDDFCAPGAECIWRLSRVLPATRAFFFGSWRDNYFIGRLFTNITTCERDGKTDRLFGW